MSSNENKSGRPKKEINPFNNIFRELVGTATQQEVADKIGVSRQNVGRWLSGDTTPDINTLGRIANAYNVSTDYLLGRTPNKTTNPELQAVCEYTGLSEKAIRNIAFVNAVYEGFEIRPPITMRESINRFFECDNFEVVLMSIHDCAKKYINNNMEIAKLEQQLIDDPESEKLKELIHELQEKKEFAKWRASETFLGCMDVFLETNFDKKDGDPNG